MKKLDINVDLDGIVVSLHDKWMAVYNAEYGGNLAMEQITDWDMAKFVPPEHSKIIFDIIGRPGFFADIEPIPGAIEGLKQLQARGHNVTLVTAGSGNALTDKETWIKVYAPNMLNHCIMVQGKTPKGAIRADVLFDDGPHNILDFRKNNPAGFIASICYPYMTMEARCQTNLILPYIDPVFCWREFLRNIDILAGSAR